MIFFLGAEAGQGSEAFQPLFGQQAESAIAQADHGIAAAESGEERREAGCLAVVIDLAVEFEPVDARLHVDLSGAGTAECLALRLHVPAGAQKFAYHARHGLGRQAQGAA